MKEEKKSRIKRLYNKLAHNPNLKRVLGVGAFVMLSQGGAEAKPGVEGLKSDIKTDQTEYTVDNQNNIDIIFENDAQIEQQLISQYISDHSLGELRDLGFLSYEAFENYHFTKEDFQQMQYGRTGENVSNRLRRAYGNRNPQGNCLASVRQKVADETGVNILTVPMKLRNRKGRLVSSYPACNWGQGIKNAGEKSPMLYLGCAYANNDDGNVSLMDLLYLQGITIMEGGKVQPRGHVCMNKPIYDNNGEYMRTDARCDGNESLERILSHKMNARYGNKVEFYCFEDDKPSRGMANYLAKQLMEYASENNSILTLKNDQLTIEKTGDGHDYFAQNNRPDGTVSWGMAYKMARGDINN